MQLGIDNKHKATVVQEPPKWMVVVFRPEAEHADRREARRVKRQQLTN